MIVKNRWLKHLYSARHRCRNKNASGYKNYGGKGIKCLLTKEEAKSLWMRDEAWNLKEPSIDRIDPMGDYVFENCRFIEWKENTKRAFKSGFKKGHGFSKKKDRCPKGHPYSGENLIINKKGYSVCKICSKDSQKKYKMKTEKKPKKFYGASLAGQILGSIKTEKKATTSRENGKLGGYWKWKKNRNKENTDENNRDRSEVYRKGRNSPRMRKAVHE